MVGSHRPHLRCWFKLEPVHLILSAANDIDEGGVLPTHSNCGKFKKGLELWLLSLVVEVLLAGIAHADVIVMR